jgi:hypothetical protein
MLLVAPRVDEQQVVLVGPGQVGALRDDIKGGGRGGWLCSRAGGRAGVCRITGHVHSPCTIKLTSGF